VLNLTKFIAARKLFYFGRKQMQFCAGSVCDTISLETDFGLDYFGLKVKIEFIFVRAFCRNFHNMKRSIKRFITLRHESCNGLWAGAIWQFLF